MVIEEFNIYWYFFKIMSCEDFKIDKPSCGEH